MDEARACIFTLKAATRDLLKMNGGQERASLLTGTSQSRICEASSPNYSDCTMRLHHLAILEADARVPVVTKVLAQLQGYELVPLGTFQTEDPHLHLARIIKDTGEVTGAISQSLADGKISQDEARRLKREADEAIDALHGFVAQMNGLIEGN